MIDITGAAVASGWNAGSVPCATFSHGSDQQHRERRQHQDAAGLVHPLADAQARGP